MPKLGENTEGKTRMAVHDSRLTATQSNTRSFLRVVLSFRRWWRDDVIGTVDRLDCIAKRRADAYTSPRYLFMLAMSAGIAVLGLLLSSPAVIIGAMLIAPLMGPILGAGFALAIGDYSWLKGCVWALVWGTLLAVGLCALIVYVSPLQTITPEIEARTRPNLFDLGVAVFSAMAGGYSMIRGREGTIVGVAIATALMPPLAVVGFGLATTNWTVFSGALLLYITNLMTIALVATLMARLYGFSTSLSDRQTNFQSAIIVVVFVALAVPLFLSLNQIVWETNATRQIRAAVLEPFPEAAQISQLDVDLQQSPITVSATVLTPEIRGEAELQSRKTLATTLERSVALNLTQFKADTASAIQAGQLAAVRERQRRVAQEEAEELTEKLALIANVDPEAVTLDRGNRRALVRAQPLPGSGYSTYRALERRVASRSPGWTVELTPPLLSLPEVPFADGEPTGEALQTIGWAAERLGLPVILVGGTPETREIAAALLKADGITTSLQTGGSVMQARWATQ
ncbi:MAG: DUF389 domain-containing protein [Pontixanthobacter sp.]